MDRYDQTRYVIQLGRAVKHAMEVRGQLLREFADLDKHPSTALALAGRIGGRCAPAFDEARRAVAQLPTPPGAQLLRDALLGWLDVHVQACDVLMRAGGTREPGHLTTAAAILRNAHPYAVRYNMARRNLAQRLVAA
jgi:hypothetical protein